MSTVRIGPNISSVINFDCGSFEITTVGYTKYPSESSATIRTPKQSQTMATGDNLIFIPLGKFKILPHLVERSFMSEVSNERVG